MAGKTLVKAYTPIWNYSASGINLIFKKGLWKDRVSTEKEFYCVSEGVKLNILVSIASVIEGSTKTFLRNRIYGLIDRKKQLDEIISKHEEQANATAESDDISDNNEGGNFDVSVISFMPPIEILKKEASQKEKTINDIILAYPLRRGFTQKICDCLRRIINKIKYCIGIGSNLSSIEEKKLKEIVVKIEKSSWNKLVGHFNKINDRKMKAVLNEQHTDLYEDINKIFQFRNFIVHSNNLQQSFNENEVHFQGQSDKLIKYINDKNFGLSSVSGKHFVEILIPDKLIVHFKNCMDLYISNKDFKKDFTTSNLRNLIWK